VARRVALDGSLTVLLSPTSLPAVQAALAAMGVDGWLLFDFRGTNPIAAEMVGLRGMVTRRIFAFVPVTGTPVAVTHAIEQSQWSRWPAAWRREVYSGWRTLESILARYVGGKRVAMEYSPGDAVPYVDRVPAGILDMVRATGAEVVSSGDLVTRFYAVWTPEQLASHQRSAEVLATVARDAFSAARAHPQTEYELQRWILDRFARAGLVTDHGPIVAIGANAADPHYTPTASRSRPIATGDLLLIDLFAREPDGVYADQTWVGTLGAPDTLATTVWEAVRDAREAATALLQDRIARGQVVRGFEADDAARAVIDARGYGPNFIHRTGHSIDARDLHGSGPHLDNLETRDDRVLLPGAAFSIEPGIYLPGVLGVRSEVNAVVRDTDLLVTPTTPQRDLFVL
jgi:Xaa-Pro aminopeptidase